jgi:hypothetical protein
MSRLVLESYLLLLQIEGHMQFRDLRSIHHLVRGRRVRSISRSDNPTAEQLCNAMDFACAFYLKSVLCLQRSAATTLLLRRHGHHADLLIGAQMIPFKAHAWVEVNRSVVNDKPYMREMYRVLEHC